MNWTPKKHDIVNYRYIDPAGHVFWFCDLFSALSHIRNNILIGELQTKDLIERVVYEVQLTY